MKQPLEINFNHKEMIIGVFHLSLIKKIKNKQMKFRIELTLLYKSFHPLCKGSHIAFCKFSC